MCIRDRSVGDTKAVTINGTVQGFTFSNLSVQAFITGFNHNASREGNHKIHFQLGKISNKLVALCDNNYNSTGSVSYTHLHSRRADGQ